MQFLVITRRKTETFDQHAFDALVHEEISAARILYGSGFTRQLWHRGDGCGACQVVEADNITSVHQKLSELPFIKNGMLDVEVLELAPYRGFCAQ